MLGAFSPGVGVVGINLKWVGQNIRGREQVLLAINLSGYVCVPSHPVPTRGTTPLLTR